MAHFQHQSKYKILQMFTYHYIIFDADNFFPWESGTWKKLQEFETLFLTNLQKSRTLTQTTLHVCEILCMYSNLTGTLSVV